MQAAHTPIPRAGTNVACPRCQGAMGVIVAEPVVTTSTSEVQRQVYGTFFGLLCLTPACRESIGYRSTKAAK